MYCKNSTNGNFCRKFHPNSHTTSGPTHKDRRHNARVGLRGISNRLTKLAFWNIKHPISSVKRFTRQFNKCAYMHNEITENTWKAEDKRHKLKRSRRNVINTSRRYLGKNRIATKGGPPYPHNERCQSMFFGFIAVSGAIEKYLLTFSTETKHEWSFTSGKVQFLHHSSAKKWLQKLIETHVREHLILSSPQRTVSMTTPAEKKRSHQFSSIILSPENKVRRHNDRNEWKSTVTTHQKVSTKLTA